MGVTAGMSATQRAKGVIEEDIMKYASKAAAGFAAYAAVSGFIGLFFPFALAGVSSSCNSGECMWSQIQPYVEQYVDQKISNAFADMWSSELKKVRVLLNETRDQFELDQRVYGNNSDIPSDGLFKSLYDIHFNKLTLMAVDFAPTYDINSTKGMYLDLFASLHISVMTSLFAAPDYGDASHRVLYQRRILCYAKRAVERAVGEHQKRLDAIILNLPSKHPDPMKCCAGTGRGRHCGMCPRPYCQVVDVSNGCKAGRMDAQGAKCHKTSCDFTEDYWVFEKRCNAAKEAHAVCVQNQIDYVWYNWLNPVTDWIAMVARMQAKDVHPNSEMSDLPDMGSCSF